MTYKWIGALLVIVGCGGCGFSIAREYRHKERLLRELSFVLTYMECELQYQLTPLPELCRHAGKEAGGVLRKIFRTLSLELDKQLSPDVYDCMVNALKSCGILPPVLRNYCLRLGRVLGRFDVDGQIQGLRGIKYSCKEELKALGKDRDNRIRSYQTLGLCAGTALVILFL